MNGTPTKVKKNHSIPKIMCTDCGKERPETEFYLSQIENSIFGGVTKIPVCKKCIQKRYEKFYGTTGDEQSNYPTLPAVYNMCMLLDIGFFFNIYEAAVNSSKGQWSKVFGHYMRLINSGKNYVSNRVPFFYGERMSDGAMTGDGFEEDPIKMSRLAKDKKKEVITLLGGYDPYQTYSEMDQQFLYQELLKYLNDDVLEDPYTLSQIIQIVGNNNQIRKADYAIARVSSSVKEYMDNTDTIKMLTDLKNKIVANNDKIAKENSISAKNRKNNTVGKNTLANRIKEAAQHGFEDAKTNYFDQKTSSSMQRVSDISMTSIFSNIRFDEATQQQLFETQYKLIQQQEKDLMDLKESLRREKENVIKLKKQLRAKENGEE